MVLLNNAADALGRNHLFSYRQAKEAPVTVFSLVRSLDLSANQGNSLASQTCRRLAGTEIF